MSSVLKAGLFVVEEWRFWPSCNAFLPILRRSSAHKSLPSRRYSTGISPKLRCLLAETPVLLRRNSTAISVKLRYLFGIISATLRRNATILSIRRRISDGCKPSDSCQKGINLTKTAHFPNVKILSVLLTKGRRVIVNQSNRGCQERPKKCGDRPYLPITTISH